ncbi:MAG: L,D-transpeptidase family protein [Candidatus Wenzhouxiangella sp. M2_3B_020]
MTRSRLLPSITLAALAASASPATAVTWPIQPDTDVVGELITDTLRPDDTLIDMARMHNIGHFAIRAANPGIDPWLPAPGTEVTIPQLHVLPAGPREGVVINLSERRLYYFAEEWPDRDGPVVSTHPVGVGLLERSTPVLRTHVTARVDDPAWYPTPEVRAWYRREKNEILPPVVPPGPENPLGRHALILDADGLMIHGTHRPAGVGMRVSQGCIRLYPESIANLIRQIPVGTEVRIVHEPARLGWRSERLYLEVDPPGDESHDRHAPAVWTAIEQRLQDARSGTEARVDLAEARAAFERADGIPVVVGRAPAPPGNETAGQGPGG